MRKSKIGYVCWNTISNDYGTLLNIVILLCFLLFNNNMIPLVTFSGGKCFVYFFISNILFHSVRKLIHIRFCAKRTSDSFIWFVKEILKSVINGGLMIYGSNRAVKLVYRENKRFRPAEIGYVPRRILYWRSTTAVINNREHG